MKLIIEFINFIVDTIDEINTRRRMTFHEKQKEVILLKNNRIPSKLELDFISNLEKTTISDWSFTSDTRFNELTILRIRMKAIVGNNLIVMINEGDERIDIDVYELESEKFKESFEDTSSDYLKKLYYDKMRIDNPYYLDIKKRGIDFENSKLKTLSPEIISNLFRADYEYCNRSYKYQRGKWKNGEFIEPKLGGWQYKSHRYFSRTYFNSIKLGKIGWVIREYVGKNRYVLYRCQVIKKNYFSKVIVYKIGSIIPCTNDILDELKK